MDLSTFSYSHIYWIFLLPLIGAGADIVTGWIQATINGTWDSTKMRKGLYRKGGELLTVIIGFNYSSTETNPNGDEARALEVAKAEYYSRLSAMFASDTASRVMSVVSLMRADGRLILCEHIGAFPDMTPKPEPEPVEQPVEAGGES